MAGQLKGKVAVITGSTSGIGQGIAEAFAREGASVMLNGFGDKGQIEALRAKVEKASGAKAIYDAADMAKPDEISAMIRRAADELGGVDILVNNAGIQHVAPVDEFPPEKWDAIIAINLTSAFHTTRHALPHMKKAKWGRIINLASAHGLVASPFKTAYVAAKHGMVGLTKSVALEVAEHNIRCNSICPGFVHTPLVEKQIEDRARENNMSREQAIRDIILAPQPTKQFVKIEEVAALAVFLASPAADQINGAQFSIDGGWTAR
ncbi:MAG: 3-hydroxybutyrate dehydrogenase [Burkholderiales bacterium]|nr:3-hydroxybutyrate dehydrogenase [Burkholderiales bacterium]